MKEEKRRIPLRIILNNFLNHIEKLECQRSPDDSYEKEFQELKLFSENLKGQKQYGSGEGEKEVNRKKNRYKDILPFDFSRVVLSEYTGTAGSDYINANFIRGASGSPAYIASQGPLPHTVNDFWRMVVECEVHVIIMACNEDEAGKHKCEKYWVDREGEVKQFGMVRIRLIQGSDVCPDFSVRTMKLEYTNKDSTIEERTVCQFHYSAWPDHGVPPSVRPLLDMVRLVRDTQASETLPVLVHCSAGCGRTGTICAIDYVWGLLRAGKLTKDFSLHILVREMRRQRVAMVQTTEQYILVHRAVRELFKEQLRVIDSHPYENIDVDGVLLHNKSDEEPLYESVRNIDDSTKIVSGSKPIQVEDLTPAPPLPRKNRIHTAASKYEKEVENQTQKQRTSQGGPVGIAKLKAMFERSPVSRSQSLGRRQASNPLPAEAPSCPVTLIKRSKSLRIIGEKNRLSILAQHATKPPSTNGCNKVKPPSPKNKPRPGILLRRRRSFESDSSPKPFRRSLHLDDDGRKLLQDCKDFLSRSVDNTSNDYQRIDSILSGKGIRERRDSFRQAISKKSELSSEKVALNFNSVTVRQPSSQKNHDGPDEVDGPIPQQSRFKINSCDIDASQSNVIVVKSDRSSPKVDLYVKGLSGEIVPSNSGNCIENSCDPLKQFGVIWNRAATSIDLKSNLRNSDLSLQELKSRLRREGTAHELKTRKNDTVLNALPAKPYKSLDRVPKKDEQNEQMPIEWKPPVSNSVMGTPHRSPQTTMDCRNPLPIPSSPHRSPQTTVDRRNPLSNISPHQSPQATVDRRHPLHASSSPHRSPQATFDRRNALPSPHQSPHATVDRRNPMSSHASPRSSPQTTVDRRNPLSASASPHNSPQTTVDRRNPLSSHSSPHHSPQTTVDRRNNINQLTGVLMASEALAASSRNSVGASQQSGSPQTTVDRRNSNPSIHISPQTTVDRRAPPGISSTPQVSPQTTVDRRNISSLSVPPSMPSLSNMLSSGVVSNGPSASSKNHQLVHSLGPMVNGHGPIRPSLHIDQQIMSSKAQPRQTPHQSARCSNSTITTSEKKSLEPYSYGLVASILRRGSQDDLALCVSGNSTSPKASTSSVHPSAPPRIKRHASVVIPRKGNKEANSNSNPTNHVDPKRWAAKQVTGSPRKMLAFPPGPLPAAVPPPSVTTISPHAQTVVPVTTSPQSSGSSKPRNSPKKSAASSLSRALGALQLRRSGPSASPSPGNSKLSNEDAAATVQKPGLISALTNKNSIPFPSAVAPTLVINPGKTVLPPGIMDDVSKRHTPAERQARNPTSFPVNPVHTQSSYPPHSHSHGHPLPFSTSPSLSVSHPHAHFRPHSHPHPHSSPAQRPPPQSFQHRHPFQVQRLAGINPSPASTPHVFSQLSHQHPKTHKKQQYL